MLVSSWLSSGTMAPYASGSSIATVTEPCHYLVNTDHGQFQGAYLMLDGADRKYWEWSVVLRRILYPLISFPLMKVLGFEVGGFIANILLHVGTFAAFAVFFRRRFGDTAAIAGMWLLSLYPGIYYWVGLPYAYAAIVPCSLAGMMILWKLGEQENLKKSCALLLIMGTLFIAYDLLPFFGLATVLVFVLVKRYKLVPLAVLLLLVPSIISNYLLWKIFRVPLLNDNSAVYLTVIGSYLRPGDLSAWRALLLQFPKLLWDAYFYSNFLFLPLLFLLLVLVNVRQRKLRFAEAEIALLASVLIVFLFLNLAPPYPGRWQLRGNWINRLYQPVFVAMLTFSMRALGRFWEQPAYTLRVLTGVLFAVTLAGNASVSLGPIMNTRFASRMYYRFYRQDDRNMQYRNLLKYGRRPLGFCRPQL